MQQNNTIYSYDSLDETSKLGIFQTFKAKFDRKVYSYSNFPAIASDHFVHSIDDQYPDNSTEHYLRYNHFKAFLKTVDDRNRREKASGGSAIHGITKYADVGPDDFARLLGGNYRGGSLVSTETKGRSQTVHMKLTQPSSRDWTNSYTTPVKGIIRHRFNHYCIDMIMDL